ncbi:MAG: tRNA (N6-isopentenyl adenosine(37)-C2)-methylthiotransferase MiaB, partial [Gemmatimonadetes bacterium]|nr:tRNA (N6-isopentenyl adenosine(37)-C2)-methylthiotransferase MiaB [Gemmatimonadota bacterium]
MASKKAVYIETYGCQMNVYDSRAILDHLRPHGYERVERPDQAELLLLNTCAVRDNAEQRVLGRIGELQQHTKGKDGVLLGVVGCMAQRLGDTLAKQRRVVDLVVGTDGYGRIPGLVDEILSDGRQRVDVDADGQTTYAASPEADPTNNTHFISISRGCDYRCTFCVVPNTRGVLRAKHPDQVLSEVEAVVEGGGIEVTLLGQNVTAYRHPEASFAQLIQRVAGVDGLRRLRFLTSHPTDFPLETLEAIAASDKISPWLHLPIQSGNDRVLRRMKRGYRLHEYMAVVEHARRMLPDVTFSTDIIVGFPGETEEQFQDTLAVMREMDYDSAFMFKYSERPGTPAARLDDDVPEDVKSQRLYRVIDLQNELWAAKAQR